MTYTAIIADDENLLRAKVRRYLEDVPWIQLAAETVDGPSTVRAVDELKPDLLFLDVKMPGLTGVEVLGRIKHKPTVVFTTAYDQYAVTAFELRAIDYLLKPFGKSRFHQALSRVKETIGSNALGKVDLALEALRRDGELAQLFVRTGSGIASITLSDVSRFEAQGDYVAIYTDGKRYLANLRMDALERALEPKLYLRIHRGHIVSLEHVQSIGRHESGRFEVTMYDGTNLLASRGRSRELRKRLV